MFLPIFVTALPAPAELAPRHARTRQRVWHCAEPCPARPGKFSQQQRPARGSDQRSDPPGHYTPVPVSSQNNALSELVADLGKTFGAGVELLGNARLHAVHYDLSTCLRE